MIKADKKYNEILEELGTEKNSYCDSPEELAAIEKMNKEMAEVRREFQRKDLHSQMAAGKVVLNA